jgi:hypothetical protein
MSHGTLPVLISLLHVCRSPSAVWFHGLAGALRPATFKDLLVSSQDSRLVLARQPEAPKDHQNFQHVDHQLNVSRICHAGKDPLRTKLCKLKLPDVPGYALDQSC